VGSIGSDDTSHPKDRAVGPASEHPAEEVVVRKEAEQRTETISDTVLRTEVDVEDERGSRVSGTGTNDPTR
jgi:hypothetical protein